MRRILHSEVHSHVASNSSKASGDQASAGMAGGPRVGLLAAGSQRRLWKSVIEEKGRLTPKAGSSDLSLASNKQDSNAYAYIDMYIYIYTYNYICIHIQIHNHLNYRFFNMLSKKVPPLRNLGAWAQSLRERGRSGSVHACEGS